MRVSFSMACSRADAGRSGLSRSSAARRSRTSTTSRSDARPSVPCWPEHLLIVGIDALPSEHLLQVLGKGLLNQPVFAVDVGNHGFSPDHAEWHLAPSLPRPACVSWRYSITRIIPCQGIIEKYNTRYSHQGKDNNRWRRPSSISPGVRRKSSEPADLRSSYQ